MTEPEQQAKLKRIASLVSQAYDCIDEAELLCSDCSVEPAVSLHSVRERLSALVKQYAGSTRDGCGTSLSCGPANFSAALYCLLHGLRLCRQSWNGRGQYVYYVDATFEMGDFLAIHPTKGPDRPWVPSISDLLAEDWCAPGVKE